jgi:predicted enzyme related to lactoylglutathione lyase
MGERRSSPAGALRLAAARIFATDLDEAASFYADVLGLRVRARSIDAGYVVFDAGACDLVVERAEPQADGEDPSLVGRFTGLSFAVDDLEATHAVLEQRGVRFTGKPERQAWGGVLATLVDPAGNQVQLVQYPAGSGP